MTARASAWERGLAAALDGGEHRAARLNGLDVRVHGYVAMSPDPPLERTMPVRKHPPQAIRPPLISPVIARWERGQRAAAGRALRGAFYVAYFGATAGGQIDWRATRVDRVVVTIRAEL
jgi:hypothetical protein